MNISLDCIPCMVSSFLRLLKSGMLTEKAKEPALRFMLEYLSKADYSQSPPVLAREWHRMVRKELNNTDPYREIKEKYNLMMLNMYSDLEEMVNSANDPFNTALRLAIAGNVIDFGPQYQVDIMDTINRVMCAQLAIDDSRLLKEDLKSAQTLLYIGDNCGEIVMDKLFLGIIDVPKKYFVVRDGPIINDVTIEDAKLVGMNRIAEVITTGDDSPGVVWESTSDEFKEKFNEADVIISKGQGNLEGLIDVHRNIYFLLVTKCELIAKRIGTSIGGFVVKRGMDIN